MILFEAPRRRVDRVFIHCTASDVKDGGINLLKLIDGWHKERGWDGIGYHYLIDKEGAVLVGRSLEKSPAAQRGHNKGTIAIAVHGLDSFSVTSREKLHSLCKQINEAYHGRVSFHGHREVAPKSCPIIDYRDLLRLDRFGRIP